MAGIYFHIPYCKQACHYCDFHFSTSTQSMSAVLQAMEKELVTEKDYLHNQIIKTVYFGGGTPSILPHSYLASLFDALHKYYDASFLEEVTLEANPDDISKENLKFWHSLGINRFSIGVQSFQEDVLKQFNRAHSSRDAEFSVKMAQDAGFHNISIDLMYGHPWLSTTQWRSDILQTLALEVPHISAYSLTIEPKTAFARWLEQGKIPDIDDAVAAQQLELLWELAEQVNLLPYEISSFAKPSFEGKHNSNYWNGDWYLGIGPSAHSFNGSSRRWNVANNTLYAQGITINKPSRTLEMLSERDKFNEYILTNLRRERGISLEFLRTSFDYNLMASQGDLIASWQYDGLITVHNDSLSLTKKGKLLADNLSASLFLV